MLRRNFIKISGLGITALSLSSFHMIQSEFSKDDLMGKSDPVFYGDTYKLRKEAHEAFLKMKAKASESGIKIKTVSSYRNYAHQNRIWERKYKKFTKEGLSPIEAINKIIEYSTIPGTSRHHWGTDIDIVDGNPKQPKGLLLEKNFHEEGPFCKFKEWMDINANSFGFFLVYTNKKDRKGFKYEPWHYSYAPLSIPMLKSYKKLNLKNELQSANLLGSDQFTIDFIQKYISENVLDINPKLL
ncbi:D-alanyl-D-alanine carboxypeptidase [Aquimarina amphilecti]|uniref:D-alanyl-D-alanine carboxypeptidase n=1 Tax=Aquimarina amphilecti TaxID=1038014 RepID=A0A1H7M0N6_AQUAM|nr:M15 family metallopeptidase [Aquimarina amphilecti]SEL04305.1 D-alanyl-D-alanine carboxypeptidase [Aquimarina amphilecti]